jgi:hypothetical protein
MVTLELTDPEAEVLKTALQHLIIDLEREIAHTDSREYKKDLERTEQLLRVVTGHLQNAA